MSSAIRIDFLHQLLLVVPRGLRDRLLHVLLQIRVRLDVGPVHKHHFRRQITCSCHFFQHPAEHSLDHFCRESMPERIADRRKMRQRLRHRVPQKPPVCHVHFHVPHRLPQRSDPEQMLNQYQLEQDHRIDARAAIVFAVQLFHQVVDMREVHRRVDLSQQVVSGYQHVRAQQFDRLALFGLSVHHFHHLGLLYQKRPLMATFFDRLRPCFREGNTAFVLFVLSLQHRP